MSLQDIQEKDIKSIIDGLQFTVEMFLFDPFTGETLKEPRNELDKITVVACKGAIQVLKDVFVVK